VALVDGGCAARDPHEGEEAQEPEHRAVDGPAVTATTQAPHARQVEEGGEGGEGRPQWLELPLGDEADGCELRRQWSAGEVFGRGGFRQLRPRNRLDGRCSPAESGGQTRGETHERDLAEHEPPQPPRRGADSHPADDPTAL